MDIVMVKVGDHLGGLRGAQREWSGREEGVSFLKLDLRELRS